MGLTDSVSLSPIKRAANVAWARSAARRSGDGGPEMAPLLKTLVQEAALPLKAIETTFAVDSTGFATNTYSRWYDEKYGGEKKCQR
jgi:hypothetical protein